MTDLPSTPTPPPVPGSDPAGLREDATRRLSELTQRAAATAPPGDVDRLVHELGVHQIELDMQNEQLRLAHAALEGSHARYRDLYENAPVGYVTTRADMVTVEANRMACTILGRAAATLVGRRLVDFMPMPDRQRYQQAHRDAVAGGAGGPVELRFMRPLLPAGSAGRRPDIVVAEIAMSWSRDSESGSHCRVTLVDVTERSALRERLALLAAIVTSSEDAIVSRDREGRVTSWNAGAERLFGYTGDEMVGGTLEAIVPEDRRAEEHELMSRLAEGGRLAPVESERLRRDGARVPVSLSLSAIRGDGGRLTGTSLIARDIGERKRAERTLHRQMRQLDLLSQAGQALIMGDARQASMPAELFDRVRLSIGCELCLSFEIGEAPDTLCLVAEHGLAPARREALAQMPLDGSLCGIAARRRAPLIVENLESAAIPEAAPWRDDGVRCFAAFPLVAHGEVLGVAAFGSTTRSRFREGELRVIQSVCDQASAMLERGRLIEALHARERSLRLADRRKDDFIATLAHELRNPLAPIRNAVDILRRRGLQDPQLDWCRDVIQRQVTQMTHLLEDLLDVSRVTRNKIELRRERVGLKRVVDDAIETTQPLIRAQGHALSVCLPAAPVVVYGDPTRLTQVLANLLNNAAKYTDAGGHLGVEVHVEGEEVCVEVRDDGIGIEEAQLARIFEMFSQLEPALHRSHGGLGIGLSLSRALVELHGGRLEAHSDGPGRGSRFTVVLPVMHAEPEPVLPSGFGELAANGARVLVVDDNVDAAQTLATMLALQGMDVRAAFGGREGLEVAEQWRPDVVVLDIGMPDMNGYEVVRRLRAQPWGEAMLTIACTGWGQQEDLERARAAGFDHHLIKPIEPEAVERIVARRHAHSGVPG